MRKRIYDYSMKMMKKNFENGGSSKIYSQFIDSNSNNNRRNIGIKINEYTEQLNELRV